MPLAHVSVIFFLVHAGLTVGANGQGEHSLEARHGGDLVEDWIRGESTVRVYIAQRIYSGQIHEYAIDTFHEGLTAATNGPRQPGSRLPPL